MGDYFQNQKREKSRLPHPVWRGIGFMMVILIPIFSFALGDVLVNYARTRGFAFPEELRSAPIEIPIYGIVMDVKLILIVAFVIALILFALFSIINAAVYGSSQESTYQVFESEPKRFKRKKKLYKPNYD